MVAISMEREVLLEQLQRLQSAMPCSFSFGLAPWIASSTLDETIVLADKALYVDKRHHQSQLRELATDHQPD
jgi:hypothetical protein